MRPEAESTTTRAGKRAIALAAVVVLAAILTSFTSRAAPYRDELAIPSYRVLAAMMTQVSETDSVERMRASFKLLEPLTRALSAKYGVDLGATFERALSRRDKAAMTAALATFILFDAQDLVEGMARNDETGWQGARIEFRKAVLDYGLVTHVLREKHAAKDDEIKAAFEGLLARLRAADLTADPAEIETAKRRVVTELAQMRAELANEKPSGGPQP